MDIVKLRHGRYGADAVVLANKIYVIGGFGDGVYLRSVERYDSGTNRWTIAGQLNVARQWHRCCIIRDSILAVGGYTSDGVRLASIEQYDVQLDKWSIVSQLKLIISSAFCTLFFISPMQFRYALNVPVSSFGIGVINDWVYIAGGRHNDESCTDELHRINVSDGRNERLTGMNYKMCGVHFATSYI